MKIEEQICRPPRNSLHSSPTLLLWIRAYLEVVPAEVHESHSVRDFADGYLLSAVVFAILVFFFSGVLTESVLFLLLFFFAFLGLFSFYLFVVASLFLLPSVSFLHNLLLALSFSDCFLLFFFVLFLFEVEEMRQFLLFSSYNAAILVYSFCE